MLKLSFHVLKKYDRIITEFRIFYITFVSWDDVEKREHD